MSELKMYVGTKIIWARPEFGPPEVVGKSQQGDNPGYRVRYEDGYESWSPKKVFDRAYQPITGLNFSSALFLLKRGSWLQREGWNGKGMYLFLVDTWDYENSNPQLDRLPFIAMKTAQGQVVPWLASQTDMLANDWQVVEVFHLSEV